MAGYLVAVHYPGHAGAPISKRYLNKDVEGWHATGRDKAHVFPTIALAEEARLTGEIRRHPTTIEWVGPEPEPPVWLKAGELVSLPGGPFWTVYKVEGAEVHLTPPEGGPACVWGLDLFLKTWNLYVATRFDRDDPI
jgi:hypothetical protein